MKSRKGRIFKRIVYFLISICALQSLATITYSVLVLGRIIDSVQFDQLEAFRFVGAVIFSIIIGAVYQIFYKAETSPVMRKLFLGWSLLAYPCSLVPGVFAYMRGELLMLGTGLNFYADEWFTMTIITLYAVCVFITVAAAVMIVIDMAKNFKIAE